MGIIRSFVAIELPQELKERIDAYQRQLKPLCRDVKWVNSQSLHITLKFLGNQEAELVQRVQNNLANTTGVVQPFNLTIREFGAFPGKRQPRVLWLGVISQPHEPLYELFNFIENSLHGLGFQKEKRRFSPHLTLARVKRPSNFEALWRFVEKNPFEPFSFTVNEIVLMQSFLKPQGAVYKPIEKFPL